MTNLLNRRKKTTFFFLYVILSTFYSVAEKRIYFCDKLTKEPLEFVHIRGYVYYDGSWGNFSTFSDSTGVVSLDVALDTPVRNIAISRVGYSPLDIQESTIGELPDTIFFSQNTRLDAVTSVYKRENGKIIYNAENDSSIQHGNGLDAIRATPTLYTLRGDILAERGQIVFRLNGARDYTMKVDAGEFMRFLPAKYLKRIEVSDTTLNGQDAVEVNVVAKRRLIGFKGHVVSELSDRTAHNAITLQGRTARTMLELNVGIFNHYDSHASKYENNLAFNSFETIGRFYRTGRYWEAKSNGFRIEPTVAYNVDDKSTLEFRYRGLFMYYGDNKSHGSCFGSIFGARSDTIASYSVDSFTKRNDNSDHDLYVRYRRDLGTKGEKGMLNVSYNMYNLNSGYSTNQTYTGLQIIDKSNFGNASAMLFDYVSDRQYMQTYHILQTDYGYWLASRQYLSASVTYYNNRQKTINDQIDTFIHPMHFAPSKADDDYAFEQLQHYLSTSLYYTYWFKPIKVSIGGNLLCRNNKLNYVSTTQAHNRQSETSIKLTPYLNLSIPNFNDASFSYSARQLFPSYSASNPHINNLTPGMNDYGNMNLKPENIHNLSFSLYFNIGKMASRVQLSDSYTTDLLGYYRFVKDGILHTTYGNIGKRNVISLFASANRSWRGFYLNVNGTVEYSDVRSPMLGRSAGFWGKLRGNLSYNLPLDISLYVEGSYVTPMKLLQGKVNGYCSYDISLSRYLDPNEKWNISLHASDFISTHRNRNTNRWGTNYCYEALTRRYQANFGITVIFYFNRYRHRFEINKNFNVGYDKSNYDV